MGLTVGLVPSLLIGASAYGASELIFKENKKKEETTNGITENIAIAKQNNLKIKRIVSQVEDNDLKKNIEEISDSVDKIILAVEKKPQKYKLISNFFEYYLPVTINILSRYDEIENQKLTDDESKKFMKSTENMAKKINDAFKKQLSNLYQSDIIDTDAEMKVFESMLKADGYDVNEDFNIDKEEKSEK